MNIQYWCDDIWMHAEMESDKEDEIQLERKLNVCRSVTLNGCTKNNMACLVLQRVNKQDLAYELTFSNGVW